MTKVAVHRDLCVGNGVCEALAPEMFAVGDDGEVRILAQPVSADDAELAVQAVASCPARALYIEE